MIDAKLRESVHEYVMANRDAIIQDVKDLCAINSVAGQPAEDAPFGPGPKAALAKALEISERMGFGTKNLDNHIGYAYLEGESEEYLATIAHLDVVPEGNGWKADPFTVREIEGWLLGRGVADDKGAVVLTMYMLKYIKDAGIKLPYSIRILFGCDEETHMSDTEYYLEHEPAPLFIFTPDGAFPAVCGEKGIYMYDICSAKIENSNVVKFDAGVASNVIPDLARATFKKTKAEYPQAENMEVAVEGDTVTLTAHGIGGHAAGPKNSRNAIKMIINYALDNEMFSEEELPYFELLRDLHKATDGSGIGIDADDGLFDPLTCSGDMMKFENGVFKQNVDTRYPTNTSDEKIVEIIGKRLTPMGGHIEGGLAKKPFYIDPSHPAIVTLVDTYNEIFNDNGHAFVMGGGTYARKFPLGVAYGMGSIKMMMPGYAPAFVGSAHGPEEGFKIDDLLSVLETITIAMIGLENVSVDYFKK